MTTRRPAGLRGLAHAIGYQVFYRMPQRLRRPLIRLGTPTYTVGAVVLVHDRTAPPDAPRLLLLRQPPTGNWTIPGGLIGRQEHPHACAARELTEETGLRLGPDELSPASPNALVHTRGQWIDLVFEAHIDPAEHELVVDGAEVLDAGWYRLDELPQLTVATARLLGHYGIGPAADNRPGPDDR